MSVFEQEKAIFEKLKQSKTFEQRLSGMSTQELKLMLASGHQKDTYKAILREYNSRV